MLRHDVGNPYQALVAAVGSVWVAANLAMGRGASWSYHGHLHLEQSATTLDWRVERVIVKFSGRMTAIELGGSTALLGTVMLVGAWSKEA
jgi:hypothetical protein